MVGHPCPGQEASQAWDVLERETWLPVLAGPVWRIDTMSDGSVGFPDSRWLLGESLGDPLTRGSGGKACLQMSKPSIIKTNKK